MSNAYVQRVWFSVIYKATGKKKCDCGWEVDAMNIVAMNPQELTYVRSDAHLMGEVIDVTPPPALPTNEVVKAEEREPEYVHINDDPHDGWWLRPEHQDYQKSLPESDLEPFVPTMHD